MGGKEKKGRLEGNSGLAPSVARLSQDLARDLLFAISRQYRADIGASKRNALQRSAHKRKSVALIEGRSGTWLRSQRARGSTAFEVVPIKIALSDSVLGHSGKFHSAARGVAHAAGVYCSGGGRAFWAGPRT